jgi:hypothetical protein
MFSVFYYVLSSVATGHADYTAVMDDI